MINKNIFSTRLKQLREANKLTIVDIATKLGIAKQSVHTWETMKTIPSSDKLFDLAEMLDVSIDYLVGRTDVLEVNKQKD